MTPEDQVFVDGEQIPDERILDIFQPPPGVPSSISRSSLLVGSRGSGKTTLFRYLKLTHERRGAVALHLALPSELSSITKQTGCGPMEFDIPVQDEPLVVGKTISLLALGVLGRLLNRGFTFSELDALADCVPSSCYSPAREPRLEWATELRKAVASAPLADFAGIAEARTLPSLLAELGEAVQRQRAGLPLLLLLDRADMLTTMCLVPLLEILDQPASYLALVATRPGPVPRSFRYGSIAATAGDHFAILHLGVEPRSRGWREFVHAAVRAQFGERLARVPAHVEEAIVWLCRDSPKLALETLLALMLRGTTPIVDETVYEALASIRDTQLTVAQKTLQAYHPDYRELIAGIRRQVVQKRSTATVGAVMLRITSARGESFLDHPSPTDRFIDIALRSGALCTPARIQCVVHAGQDSVRCARRPGFSGFQASG